MDYAYFTDYTLDPQDKTVAVPLKYGSGKGRKDSERVGQAKARRPEGAVLDEAIKG